MKLIDLKLNEYLDILLSDAPAPGGGSVSALAGAQGAALIAMVCDLTTMKKKYEEDHELCREIRKDAAVLYTELAASIDRDTDAYNLIADAFKMPKETDEEKAARKKAIADGTLEATKVPFNTLKLSYEGLKLADKLYGHFNTNCASDYGVGVLNFMAAIRGAWMNVKINLPGVKDEEFAEMAETEGRRMMEEGQEIARRIYGDVEASL